MDFNFTEEQDMVRDGLSRLVREQYDWEARREAIASEAGWRPEIWAQLAELGILGMPFSEDVGGFGGGAIDAMIVMEEFGKGLVVEPFVPTVVCAGRFLAQAGTDAQREEHLCDHRWQPRPHLPGRTARPLRLRRPRAHREEGRRRLRPQRAQGGGDRRALGKPSRHRPPGGERRDREGVSVFIATSRPTASSPAITKRSTGAALQRSISRTSRFPPTR